LSGQDGLFNVVFALASIRVVSPAELFLMMTSPCANTFISPGFNAAFLIDCIGHAIHPALSGRDRIVAYIPLALGPPPSISSACPEYLGLFIPHVESIGLVYNRFSCRSALAPFQKRVFLCLLVVLA
jgi:hypothetical protein